MQASRGWPPHDGNPTNSVELGTTQNPARERAGPGQDENWESTACRGVAGLAHQEEKLQVCRLSLAPAHALQKRLAFDEVMLQGSGHMQDDQGEHGVIQRFVYFLEQVTQGLVLAD